MEALGKSFGLRGWGLAGGRWHGTGVAVTARWMEILPSACAETSWCLKVPVPFLWFVARKLLVKRQCESDSLLWLFLCLTRPAGCTLCSLALDSVRNGEEIPFFTWK